MAQDQYRLADVGRGQWPSRRGRHTEDLEEVRCREVRDDADALVADFRYLCPVAERSDRAEAARAHPHVRELRPRQGGGCAGALVNVLDDHEAYGLAFWQRLQPCRVGEAEDRRAGADAEGQ